MADGKFTPVFMTEQLENISKIYKADNGTGFVFVTGESFVATDILGNIISEADETAKSTVSSQVQKFLTATITEIDISKYSLPTNILKAYKTSSGNFMFEIKAAGYGINGGNEWHPASGEYIYINVSVTNEGKIIACETVSQKETDKIGSACADESFYSQFNGKTENDYTEIDAISGATITTDGYKNGIAKVFEALKILKGEA
ncbi:MAG: FMN-binding protein [Clostridia bacterium]|nr:FMN-binding protein [Clostridia bacterium]